MKDLLKDLVKEESLKYLYDLYPTSKHLINATIIELQAIPGIGKQKAKELYTIFQINKTLLEPDKSQDVFIKSPSDVFDFLKVMQLYEEEQAIVLNLDTKNKIISQNLVSKGSISSSIVHPREVYTQAVRLKASNIIFVHNHPSGNPQPSKEDTDITKRLFESGKILGIGLIDSIIIGENSYTSFKESGMI